MKGKKTKQNNCCNLYYNPVRLGKPFFEHKREGSRGRAGGVRVEPAATKETHTNKLNQTRAQANKIGFFAQIVSFSRVFFLCRRRGCRRLRTR
jgi:hypothetical protein